MVFLPSLPLAIFSDPSGERRSEPSQPCELDDDQYDNIPEKDFPDREPSPGPVDLP
jgi:hypothetical protein